MFQYHLQMTIWLDEAQNEGKVLQYHLELPHTPQINMEVKTGALAETIYAYAWSKEDGAFKCQILEECAFGGHDLYAELENRYLVNGWVYVQTLINVEKHPEYIDPPINNVVNLKNFRLKS